MIDATVYTLSRGITKEMCIERENLVSGIYIYEVVEKNRE
jgi:hypothetical protein